MEMMKVTEILKTVDSSCDFWEVNKYDGETLDDKRTNFWLDVIDTKCRDTGMGHLIEAILEDGWAEDSAVGWDNGYITEGHHRLVAAILLCLDEVPVTKSGKSLYKKDSYAQVISAHSNREDAYPLILV